MILFDKITCDFSVKGFLTVKFTAALFIALSSVLLPAVAIAEEMDVVEQITAPGGNDSYYIVAGRGGDEQNPPPTAIMARRDNENKIILRERPDEDPQKLYIPSVICTCLLMQRIYILIQPPGLHQELYTH